MLTTAMTGDLTQFVLDLHVPPPGRRTRGRRTGAGFSMVLGGFVLGAVAGDLGMLGAGVAIVGVPIVL
jgi:uncharacterized membrane protein YoaK (UPF0700 family)